MTGTPTRIAMWSGPRNISTAMMRSFENRPDSVVWDEPFYAAYLHSTGLDHPMRDLVVRSGETDWQRVIARLVAPLPDGVGVFYQKHMTHHMVPGIDRSWLAGVTNCFLIRSPEAVLASYAAKRDDVTLADIGFVEQAEIFRQVSERTGTTPAVIDADDVLADPRGTLTQLCRACGIDFTERMLSWPAGSRSTDGAWAPHWYGAVEKSTGFLHTPRGSPPELNDRLKPIADAARIPYEQLYRHRIKPADGHDRKSVPE